MKIRHSKLFVLVCLMAFGVFSFIGCSSKKEQPDPNKPQQPAAVKSGQQDVKPGDTGQAAQPDQSVDNNVAVTVNGTVVTEDQVKTVIDRAMKQMMSRGLPAQYASQYRAQIRTSVVESKIADTLLSEEVAKDNVTVSDEEVNKKISDFASQQRVPMTVEQLKDAIEKSGEDYGEFEKEIKKGLQYTKLFESKFADAIKITDDEAKSYFEEHKDEYSSPEMVRASHILIPPDPNGDPNEAKQQALAKITDLLKQIKEGADFAELAKANSTCGSAENGGDLGFFQRGDMAEPFENAAFDLEIGKISDIVETKFGYHIIKKTGHKDAVNPTFEDVKEQVINEMTQRKQMELANEYVESLKAKATIVYPPGKEPAPARPAMPGLGQ